MAKLVLLQVGERVIHLGKDVANAPLKIETEGLLLNAPQLVTNGDFSEWSYRDGVPNIPVDSIVNNN